MKRFAPVLESARQITVWGEPCALCGWGERRAIHQLPAGAQPADPPAFWHAFVPRARLNEEGATTMATSLAQRQRAIHAQLAIPTHRCTKCGALWRYWTPNETGAPNGSWSLRSERAGPCCDNAPMGEQMEPLRYEHFPAAERRMHSDDLAVDRFAAAMKAKLAEKRAEGRGGWDDPAQCTTKHLAELLRSHIERGDPLDVGNFAMMLWNRGGSTSEGIL